MPILRFPTSNKWQIKLILIAFALSIVVVILILSNLLVSELLQREKQSIQFYADIYRRYTNPNTNTEDIDFLVNKMSNLIKFPIVMTDENDNPIFPFESYSLNIQFDTKWTTSEKREYLRKLIKKMAADYEPIVILDENGLVFAKFYYTHSSLIDKFKYFPIIEIFIAILFISFGYMAFNYLRRSEESKLWVGMAKEAAHQLGTPLSSLLAWIEILQSNSEEQMRKEEILREMGNDLIRLKTISERFSKIGSPPEMKRENLVRLIDEIIDYFERRVPHLGKRIELIRNYPQKTIFADVNPVLFSWVIENLLKNSFEAIESKEGFVKITIQQTKRKILIQITDNGRGMTTKQRRSAFLPGFTTKKRGWGIGLTFCKRIIEDYHKSKIYIKETSVGKGTTFAIELPNKFPLFE